MEEFIRIPVDCCFIRGVKDWKRNDGLGLRYGEISVSLHKEGRTVPFRDYGYVLAIEKDGITAAYPSDVTSFVEDGYKVISNRNRNWIDFKDDLEALIQATPIGKHNELFVNALKAEIVGVYAAGPGPSSGRRAFLSACKQKNLPLILLR